MKPPLRALLIGAAIGTTQISFEVASIKPTEVHDPRGFGGGGCKGADTPSFMAGEPISVPMGHCRCVKIDLRRLLASAYSNIEISGGPSWADSEFYDIDGKAAEPATATQADLKNMLHQMLADRFKLRLHPGTKEVPGYSLVV